MKRLFSLRSLSFGRKDKQKPKKAAKEEVAAAEVTTSGDVAAAPEKVSGGTKRKYDCDSKLIYWSLCLLKNRFS